MYDTDFLFTVLNNATFSGYVKTADPWKYHLLFLIDKLVKINCLK